MPRLGLSVCATLAVCAIVSVSASASTYDEYGGWTQIQGTSTGFFHTQGINGTWWLVTPAGNVFFAKGVKGIRFNDDIVTSLGYSPYNRTLVSKFSGKSVETAWLTETWSRLKKWGVNMIDGSDPTATAAHKVPYCVDLCVISQYPQYNNGLQTDVPDVFDPAFAALANSVAKSTCTPLASDQWLVGYYMDNETGWAPGPQSSGPVLDRFLAFPSSAPGHQQAEQFMKSQGHSGLAPTDTDRNGFLQIVASQYGSVMLHAIRNFDLNHLLLGVRFAMVAPDPVVLGMKDWEDVQSLNFYGPEPPTALVQHMSDLVARPVMISEFSYLSPTTTASYGLVISPNSPSTEAERATWYERYIEGMAGCTGCAGCTWFKYVDEPNQLRPEHLPFGLVNISDSPYTTLVNGFAATNPTLESLHAN